MFITGFIFVSCQGCNPDNSGTGNDPVPDCFMNSYPVNFSYLQVYENEVLIYTFDMDDTNIVESCNNQISIYLNYYSTGNPTGLGEIFSRWHDYSYTTLDYIYITRPELTYNATINGSFETFTEILGGPYRLVPVRCSTSTSTPLNFSQIQVYNNTALVHTQNTSTLTATEDCDIIYVRGFDANSSGINGFNLYWDSNHTTITDVWIYSDSGQIQSVINGPNANIIPDDFTNISGGMIQLIPVRP